MLYWNIIGIILRSYPISYVPLISLVAVRHLRILPLVAYSIYRTWALSTFQIVALLLLSEFLPHQIVATRPVNSFTKTSMRYLRSQFFQIPLVYLDVFVLVSPSLFVVHTCDNAVELGSTHITSCPCT